MTPSTESEVCIYNPQSPLLFRLRVPEPLMVDVSDIEMHAFFDVIMLLPNNLIFMSFTPLFQIPLKSVALIVTSSIVRVLVSGS